VLPPTEAIERFGQSAVFVVSVYNGSGIANQFRSAGCETVVHYASLEWKYQDAFRTKAGFGTPTLVVENAGQILHLSSLLADEESRTELARQVRWRIAHEPEWLGENKPAGETYFPPEARPLDDEVFVDCVGFTGDTVTDFLTRRQYRFKQIYAVEPDPQNLHHMKARFESLADDVRARIHILPYAVGNEDTTLHFDTQGTAGSHVSDTGTAVQCHRLDSILCDAEPTYIKMDLEGFEPKAIAGAAEVIRKHRPVMAVTLYHELNHLWNIPMQLHALNPDYKLLIRRYAEDCWEIVCYAIPPERFIPHPT
jgi:FkbM family methyltransferase